MKNKGLKKIFKRLNLCKLKVCTDFKLTISSLLEILHTNSYYLFV